MGIIKSMLSLFSGGTGEMQVFDQLLFNKVIGFKGIVDGAGASTIVQNVAVALSDKTRYKVCVLDTNMLYPCQFELLGSSDDKSVDIIDFDKGVKIGDILCDTKYSNVSVVGFKNRTVVDLVSVTENTKILDKLLDELKMFFDVILIDLSHETSNFAVEAAIKCNKIFMVCDESLKCTSNLVRSYNYITTLGVALTKCKRIILNKTTAMHTGIRATIANLKLEVFGEVPFSEVIYNQGVSGKPFYGLPSRDGTITEAHLLLDKLVDDIIDETAGNSNDDKDKSKKSRRKSSTSTNDTENTSNFVKAQEREFTEPANGIDQSKDSDSHDDIQIDFGSSEEDVTTTKSKPKVANQRGVSNDTFDDDEPTFR